MSIKKARNKGVVKKVEISNQDKSLKKYYSAALLTCILVVTFFIYQSVTSFEFLNLDDDAKILSNPYIHSLTFQNIRDMFSNYVFHIYFPVTTFSYALDNFFLHLNPGAMHFENLVLHLLVVTTVFVFCKRLNANLFVAGATGFIFAIHPIGVETVAWLSERSTLLYSFFYFISMIFYLKQYNKTSRWNRDIIFSFMFFVLSLLAKAQAVTLPFVLLALDYFLKRNITRKVFYEKIPFFIASLLTAYIAINATTATGNISVNATQFGFVDRVFLSIYPLMAYFLKFIFPLDLNILNPFPKPDGQFLPLIFYLSALFLITVILIIHRSGKHKQYLVFGTLFFLFGILTLIHIIPVGGNFLTADHFMYLPLFGFSFILANLFHQFVSEPSKKLRLFTSYFIAGFLLFISISTWDRVEVWKNSNSLFSKAVEQSPENEFAYYGLATAQQEAGEYYKSLKNFNIAIELKPDYAEAYYNRGLLQMQLQEFEKAKNDFSKTIEYHPDNYAAYNNRGNMKKILSDTSGAIQDFTKSLSINPRYAAAYYNRGSLKSNILQYEDALADLDSAIILKSDYPEALVNRGIVNYFLKNYQTSLDDYTKAIELQSNFGLAFFNRGLSYLAMKDTANACSDWNTAADFKYKPAISKLKKYCYSEGK